MTPDFLAYYEREGCRRHGDHQAVMWAAWEAARRNHERVALIDPHEAMAATFDSVATPAGT